MTITGYQEKAHSFASYGGSSVYPYLELVEEAGEVAGKLAKYIRHNDGSQPARAKEDYERYVEDVKKELGDVMWGVAEIATMLGLELEDICISNINKLADRQARGVIDGAGDNR